MQDQERRIDDEARRIMVAFPRGFWETTLED